MTEQILSFLDETKKLIEETKLGTAILKQENRNREVSLHKKMLGGISEAKRVIIKKEETPKEYRQRIYKELAEGKLFN